MSVSTLGAHYQSDSTVENTHFTILNLVVQKEWKKSVFIPYTLQLETLKVSDTGAL